MSEFDIIRDYFSSVGAKRQDVLLAVGDDGAVLKPDAESLQISVMDTLIESIHFPRTSPGRSVGHRALAVNLSDVAAMGAMPCWASLSLSMPRPDADWLADFAAGFAELAHSANVQLIGGDTVSGPLCVTVHVMGTVAPGQQVLRSGALTGDAIYVTGTLGDSAAGLRAMTRGESHSWLIDQFLYPQPPIKLGLGLGQWASACIDISDGFGRDLEHVLEQSGVGACVWLEKLPLSAALSRTFDDDEARYLALSGGDDYQLCIVVRAAEVDRFEQHCRDLATPVTRVGEIEATPGLRFELEGKRVSLNVSGHDHFDNDD